MVAISVDSKNFNQALKKASKEVDNLTIPLSLISREWFKGNRAIFALAGYGKYKPYSGKYENWKIKKFGKVSILKVSGRLEQSITDPTNRFSVNVITNKKELSVGTKVLSKKGQPYAIYLQNGTRKMPARPPVLFAPEQTNSENNARFKRWAEILEAYVLQKSEFGKANMNNVLKGLKA